jgi:hypothetical protein
LTIVVLFDGYSSPEWQDQTLRTHVMPMTSMSYIK